MPGSSINQNLTFISLTPPQPTYTLDWISLGFDPSLGVISLTSGSERPVINIMLEGGFPPINILHCCTTTTASSTAQSLKWEKSLENYKLAAGRWSEVRRWSWCEVCLENKPRPEDKQGNICLPEMINCLASWTRLMFCGYSSSSCGFAAVLRWKISAIQHY